MLWNSKNLKWKVYAQNLLRFAFLFCPVCVCVLVCVKEATKGKDLPSSEGTSSWSFEDGRRGCRGSILMMSCLFKE